MPSGERPGQSPRRGGGTGVPVEPVLTLIVLAVLANLAVMAAVMLPSLTGRRPAVTLDDRSPNADIGLADVSALIGGEAQGGSDVPVWAYDRVVRIASWGFITATLVIVAVSGLWPQTQDAIFVLLGLASLFVLVVHDILPSSTLGSAKFVVEGSGAITFATLLIMFTGRESSPFFFVFPLIVAGAALVVSDKVTLAL